jgi:uncharacterized glyoxalase superfamily protein PhnB
MSTQTTSGAAQAANPTTATTVFPFLRYQDARAAIRWLVDALGFAEKAVYAGPGDSVAHAELRFGDGLVMLGSYRDDALGVKPPRQLGGSTHSVCLVDGDPDARHARAAAAGAEIVRPLADQSYGARDFTCRDPEGTPWTVSTYRPAGGADLNVEVAYEDGRAAVGWLERAFGFAPQLVVPAPDGGVAHAELRCEGDGGVVMLFGARGLSRLGVGSARHLGGTSGGVYLVVADPDAHHDRARAAGAELVRPLEDTEYGSREYGCRDLEGNLWSFGTYRP